MTAYGLVVVALYPSFKNDTSLNQLTDKGNAAAALFGASGPLTTPTGWLDANLYANFVPLIALLLAIGYGAACLAGQDEDGTLAMVATLPLPRRGIVGQKAATMSLQAIPVSLATMLCVLIGRGFDLPISTSGLVGVTAGTVLLAIDFGALAMFVGAATGSRGAALGITSAVAAATYLISSLAPAVRWLHPARFASPFFYAVDDGQLSHGLQIWQAGALLAVAITLGLATAAAFERLDVR
jgi:ABC-2 type transport system permease protein